MIRTHGVWDWKPWAWKINHGFENHGDKKPMGIKGKKTINKGLMIHLNKLAKRNEEECNKIIAKTLMFGGVL